VSIPRMTFVMPLRRDLQFTTNALPTVIKHAARDDHEILIVLDTCPQEYENSRRGIIYDVDADRREREQVCRWIDAHRSLLDEHHVQVMESFGNEGCWTSGLRTAAAMNLGIEKASTEWIVGIGDEHLVFLPGWDKAMWSAIEGRNHEENVATLVMVTPQVRESWPQPLKASWIHAQRERSCHQLAFPLKAEHADARSARISLASIEDFARRARLPGGVYRETCGERSLCHWLPMLMHRKLLKRIGGWPISDASAMSFDIALDDALGRANVQKRMPLDQFVMHSMHHVHIDHDTDRVWADPRILADTAGAVVL